MRTDERTSPHSLEAETAVLGAILLHPSALSAAAALEPADFLRDAHATLFRTFRDLEAAGSAIDQVTVREALKQSGQLDAVGGMAYVASLVDGLPKSTNVEHYAQIVKQHALRRELIRQANAIVAEAYLAEDDAGLLLEKAQERVSALAGGARKKKPTRRLGEILPSVLSQLEAAKAAPGAITGVPSGLIDLDRKTRGFQPSKLYVIAARPGMGKSALLLDIARASARKGLVSLTFSLEMADEEYGARALASEARVDGHSMQGGWLGERDYLRIGDAMTELSNLPIYIQDELETTAFDVRMEARALRQTVGLDLVMVDYTQLMLSSTQSENRAIEVGNITRALKALAKELAIPVIALAQLNRGLETRQDKRPILSDLRDSGRIEEDADVVLFIYRDEYYHPESKDEGIAELILAKHRGGPLGTVKVGFVKEQTRFHNLELDRDEPRETPKLSQHWQLSVDDMRLPRGDR